MTYTVSSGTLNPSIPYHTINSTEVAQDYKFYSGLTLLAR